MRSKFGICILLVIIIVIATSKCTGILTPVGKLLIDVDGGSDDALAILMAVGAEQLGEGSTTIGITCVNGNIDVEQAALNVLKTLKVAERLDIPVYKGASHPILLPTTRDNYFGTDGFGDFDFPDPPSVDLIQPEHAVNVMVDLVKASPGRVTLLALGPLTNVALAIRMYPPFLDELRQLIIMGGSTEGQGNARPGIEFNFATDPIANYIVFNSSTSKPLTLVPYEVTQRTHITVEVNVTMEKLNSTKVWLLDHADSLSIRSEVEEYFWPDAVAATVALTTGSIVTKSGMYYSEAVYDGRQTSGMIVVDYNNATGNAANTNLIQDVDKEVFAELLLKYLAC